MLRKMLVLNLSGDVSLIDYMSSITTLMLLSHVPVLQTFFASSS